MIPRVAFVVRVDDSDAVTKVIAPRRRAGRTIPIEMFGFLKNANVRKFIRYQITYITQGKDRTMFLVISGWVKSDIYLVLK